MSSKSAMENSSHPANTTDIGCWKTPGTLASPKGITLNWKSPGWHENVAFLRSALSRATYQYVDFKSRVEKQVALPSRAGISLINGNGYARDLVISFSTLKSTQNQCPPSFSSTRTIGKLQDDLERSITLDSNISFTASSTNFPLDGFGFSRALISMIVPCVYHHLNRLHFVIISSLS